MTLIKVARSRRCHGVATRRRGALLVLVIFYLALASSLMVLVTASSVQLARTTRHEHEAILLRQLTHSARAWVRAKGGLRPDAPITLSGANVLPEDISGEVRMSVSGELPDVVVIRARLSFPNREAVRTTRFAAPL